MRKLLSKQRDVRFFFCPSPVTIDKRSEWGNSADNLQQAPNGAFLKTSSDTEISHLVQPNADKTAPIGWMPGSKPGLYDKLPIWVDDQNILQPGNVKKLRTADGEIEYTAKEPSMVCYNDLNGTPNEADAWVQNVVAVKKNYEL
ncbi:hypothetical protein EXS70_00470 [Candidatus Peribacteria bacterium]|nr:hypothetical protein [Candidatus Peribacteria bacterium]